VWSSCKAHDAMEWQRHFERHATPQMGRNCGFGLIERHRVGRIRGAVLFHLGGLDLMPAGASCPTHTKICSSVEVSSDPAGSG
jgi:hypothetical protein